MFKNRELTIKVDKRNKDQPPTMGGTDNFDKRADAILIRLEDLGTKLFIGVCAYVLLDTFRQVKVANTIYHPNK